MGEAPKKSRRRFQFLVRLWPAELHSKLLSSKTALGLPSIVFPPDAVELQELAGREHFDSLAEFRWKMDPIACDQAFDGDGLLPLDGESSPFQGVGQANLLDELQESRAQSSMQGHDLFDDEGPDLVLRQAVQLIHQSVNLSVCRRAYS